MGLLTMRHFASTWIELIFSIFRQLQVSESNSVLLIGHCVRLVNVRYLARLGLRPTCERVTRSCKYI